MHSFRHAVRRHRIFFLAFVLLETFFFIDGTTFVEAAQHHKQQIRNEKLATARVLGVTPQDEWLEPSSWIEITGESLATRTEEVLQSAQAIGLDWLADRTRAELGSSAAGTPSESQAAAATDGTVSASQLPRRLRKSAAPPRAVEALAVGEGEHTLAPSLSSAESAEKAGSGLLSTADRLPIRQQQERQARQVDAGALRPSEQLSSSIAPPSAPRSKALAGAGRQLGKAAAPEIIALAASLDNSPGKIFRHVHDNIDYDPKWGADSPPLGTLWEGRGTSWDQAWLLQELLVAAGVDARLEWGEVEIKPDLLMQIAGTSDPIRAGDLLATAGLPVVLLVVGSQVASARFPHAWVKAHLDYVPDRGATSGDGDTWVRMDPSLKTFEQALGLRLDADVSFVLGDHLQSGTEQAPRAEYEAALLAHVADNNLGAATLDELKPIRTLRAENFPFVPGTLRGRILSTAGESETMPDAYQVRLNVEVREEDGGVLSTWQASLSSVYGGLFEIRWPGATPADQSTLDLFGGVYTTPPYEVDLRPSLMLDGVEVATGTAIGSAEDAEFKATITPPAGLNAGDGEPIIARWELFAGEHGVLNVDLGQSPQELTDRYFAGALAATDPFEVEAWSLAAVGSTYLRAVGDDLDHLAALRWHQGFNYGTAVLAVQRGAVATTPDGTPDTFSLGPLSLDVGARTLGIFPVDGVPVSTVPTLELIGSQGSIREGEALAAIFGGDHVTAVGFLTLAVREGQALTRVDAGNVDAALAAAVLSTGAEGAVAYAVSQGAIAWIPETQLEINGWRSTGYIIEDPQTGSGGYFVTYERFFQPLDGAVVFHSPADLDVITAPTDVIATIDVEGIETWTLSTRPNGGDSGQVIASGIGPVENTLLGQFDPTLLVNGLHDLVLTGRDAAGQSVSGKITLVVEGQMKVGNFTLSFVDLAVPLSGLDIQVVRTYDSRLRNIEGDFGHGWYLDIQQGSYRNNRLPGDGWQIVNPGGPFGLPCSQTIESKSHITTITLSEVEVYRFRLKLGSQAPFIGGCQAQAFFEYIDGPLPGATLEILGNTFVLYENSSNRLLDQDSLEVFEPGDVKLTTRDGRVFNLNLITGVTRLQDQSGNALELTADGITHSSGVGIDFRRDSSGRIEEIEDVEGQVIAYTYDAAGDLVSHSDRAGSETTFVYREHYLEEIYNALGVRAARNVYDDDGRLVSTTDSAGHTIGFDHDLEANREVITDRLGFAEIVEYDDRGNVVREIDKLGNVIVRTYDGDDRLLNETDPLGRTMTYSYNAAGDMTSISNEAGHTTVMSRDANGRLLELTDPRGNVFSRTYDDSGNVLTLEDALGHTTSFTYDDEGNVLTETDPLGGVRTYSYDGQGRLTQRVGALGQVTSFTYSAAGEVLTQGVTRTVDGVAEVLTSSYDYNDIGLMTRLTSPDGSFQTLDYDALGRPTKTTDESGRSLEVEYDLAGRQVKQTYPDDSTIETFYDAEGRETGMKTRGGAQTVMTRDPLGRHLSTTAPGGGITRVAYDAAGQIVTQTAATGASVNYAYDDAGRMIEMTDPSGTVTRTYDALGNVLSLTDPMGHTMTMAYDALGKRTSTTFADGSTSANVFDARGRRVSTTDQAGNTTLYDYDLEGHLVKVTDALGGVTEYTYDELGMMVTATDTEGRTTRFTYNNRGHQTGHIYPDGATETRTYLDDGRRASRTDRNGATTLYTYDVNGQLAKRAYPDGSDVVFTYTADGLRETYTDAQGTTSYAYDGRGSLTSITYPDSRSLHYTYDVLGNRESMTAMVDSEVFETTYAYDEGNRLESVTDSLGRTTALGRDAVGNLIEMTYGNGVKTALGFDSRDRLTSLVSTDASGAVLMGYDITMSADNRRTRVAESNGHVRDYGFDAIGRLVSDRVEDASSALVYEETFTYDTVGNRTMLGRQVGDDVDYAYDVRDRLLTAATATGDPTPPTISYGWDANGNRTTLTMPAGEDGGATYTWDYENRLSRVALADGRVVRLAYDPDGVLVQREVVPADGSPSVVTDYLNDVTGELSHVVVESRGTLVDTVYTRAGGRLVSLYRPSSDTTRFYHTDERGSIRMLTDESGTPTDTYDYTAFGVLLEHQGVDSQPYRFSGEPFDQETGLAYHRARWLDPEVGRFVSTDPLLGVGASPMSRHRYLYANADPVNFADPTGLYSAMGGITGALVGFAIGAAITGITAIAFTSLAAKYFPENGILQSLPDALIFGGLVSRGPGDFLRYFGRAVNPLVLGIVAGLLPLAVFAGFEALDFGYQTGFYVVGGLSVSLSSARGEGGDLYGGAAFDTSRGADYPGLVYCTGLSLLDSPFIFGGCFSTNKRTYSLTIGKFSTGSSSYATAMSYASQGVYVPYSVLGTLYSGGQIASDIISELLHSTANNAEEVMAMVIEYFQQLGRPPEWFPDDM